MSLLDRYLEKAGGAGATAMKSIGKDLGQFAKHPIKGLMVTPKAELIGAGIEGGLGAGVYMLGKHQGKKETEGKMNKEARAKLENWAVAGLFAGEAYADEMKKLAALHVIDRLIAKNAVDAKTASALTEMGAKLIKGPVGKGVGAAAALGGAGALGAAIGEKKEHKKDEAEVAELAPQIFRAGFMRGAQMGFARAQGELGKK